MTMTSHRPYLIRALNEWILENDCTPYILVNAHASGVEVPQNYVKDGQIILNISPVAVHGLVVSNERIEFSGRFGGVPTTVLVPIGAVLGIYARENGQGMIFQTDDPIPEPPSPEDGGGDDKGGDDKGKGGRPSLRVVK